MRVHVYSGKMFNAEEVVFQTIGSFWPRQNVIIKTFSCDKNFFSILFRECRLKSHNQREREPYGTGELSGFIKIWDKDYFTTIIQWHRAICTAQSINTKTLLGAHCAPILQQREINSGSNTPQTITVKTLLKLTCTWYDQIHEQLMKTLTHFSYQRWIFKIVFHTSVTRRWRRYVYGFYPCVYPKFSLARYIKNEWPNVCRIYTEISL